MAPFRLITILATAALVARALTLPASADEPQGNDERQESDKTVLALPQCATPTPKPAQTGIASWYGGSFVGAKTASGERYRAADRTAAHRTLPFGTYVKVTNLRTKKTSVVRINNRGPFIKGRIIDLSRQAALDIGLVKTGIARVQVEVVAKELATAELAAL